MTLRKGGFVWRCLLWAGYRESSLIAHPISLCKVFWSIVFGATIITFLRAAIWATGNSTDYDAEPQAVQTRVFVPRTGLLFIGVAAVMYLLVLVGLVRGFGWASNLLWLWAILTSLLWIIYGLVYASKAIERWRDKRYERKPKPSSEFWTIVGAWIKARKEAVCPIVKFE